MQKLFEFKEIYSLAIAIRLDWIFESRKNQVDSGIKRVGLSGRSEEGLIRHIDDVLDRGRNDLSAIPSMGTVEGSRWYELHVAKEISAKQGGLQRAITTFYDNSDFMGQVYNYYKDTFLPAVVEVSVWDPFRRIKPNSKYAAMTEQYRTLLRKYNIPTMTPRRFALD